MNESSIPRYAVLRGGGVHPLVTHLRRIIIAGLLAPSFSTYSGTAAWHGMERVDSMALMHTRHTMPGTPVPVCVALGESSSK